MKIWGMQVQLHSGVCRAKRKEKEQRGEAEARWWLVLYHAKDLRLSPEMVEGAFGEF